MLRKWMLAGLMGATLLGGVAPAYAQRNDNGGSPRGERGAGNPGNRGGDMRGPQGSTRWQGGGDRGNGNAGGRPQMAAPAQRWQGGPERVSRPDQRPDQRADRPNGNWQRPGNPTPGMQPVARPDRPDGRGDGRRVDVRPDSRSDWNRQVWDRNRNGNDRDRNGRDWNDRNRDGRPDDRRWSDNDRRGDRPGYPGNWNNGGRRYDDRTRWADQRRWDNGWRQDRRYDWYGYRSRYGDRYRMGRYYAPSGWNYGYRSFSIGVFLSGPLYGSNYWLNDPYYYRLPPAYGTMRWIRYYDDALLVDIRDGYVVDVIRNFFW